MIIATEDELSKGVAEKLIQQYTNMSINLKLRQGGYGYLRTNLQKFYGIAKHTFFLLMTDLDKDPCPLSLIHDWHKSIPIPASNNMIFRVVVREVEAWLLADHQAMGLFLNTTNLPLDADVIKNPKDELLKLAQKAPKEIKKYLIAKKGSITSRGVGIGYNAILCDFVQKSWDPERAMEHSNSLKRCCNRLKSFTLQGKK